jgi:hypothetical protein
MSSPPTEEEMLPLMPRHHEPGQRRTVIVRLENPRLVFLGVDRGFRSRERRPFLTMPVSNATDRVQAHRWFHALSDETRLQLLELLREGEQCVCDLTEALGVAQSRLSFHLKTLKEARPGDRSQGGPLGVLRPQLRCARRAGGVRVGPETEGHRTSSRGSALRLTPFLRYSGLSRRSHRAKALAEVMESRWDYVIRVYDRRTNNAPTLQSGLAVCHRSPISR